MSSLWPRNTPLPVTVETLHEIIAAVDAIPQATARGAAVMAMELLGNWPWLTSTTQDLSVYSKNVTAVFAAFTVAAGRAALDPVTGLVSQSERPPSIAQLREYLHQFDNKRKWARHAAQNLLEENERRAGERERDARIEAERKAFREKHGDKTLLQVFQEEGKI